MTGLDPQADPLADLGPNPPRPAEKKARLIELADFILAARKRRAPLAKIAERLGVSPDYLSQVMTEHHGKAWTNDPTRRSHKAKGKKKAKARTQGTVKLTALTRGESSEHQRDEDTDKTESDSPDELKDKAESQATDTKQNSRTEPESDQPKDSDLNQHAGPRRATMRM
jgi:hypothetical protein